MQTIETPTTVMESALKRETDITEQRRGVAVKKSRAHLNKPTQQLKWPVCQSYSFFENVGYKQELLSCGFLDSSLIPRPDENVGFC